MDKQEEIKDSFKFIGCTPGEDVINTSLELCLTYNLSPEEFVDQWSAFTITHNNASLTVENILLMERKELKTKVFTSVCRETSKSYTEVTSNEHISATKRNKRARSPDGMDMKEFQYALDSESTELEEPDMSYADRTDSGEILHTFGPYQDFQRRKGQNVTVKLYNMETDWHTPDQFLYMYNTPARLASSFNRFVEMMGNFIFKKNFFSLPETISKTTMTDMTIYGRIRSECKDKEKLNGNTVRLEGSRELNNARNIVFNISQTKSFSLIPGEVVAVQGSNIYGNSFVPQEFYNNAFADFSIGHPQWEDTMQIIVAVGPYTTCNNILYQPLQDLLKHVVETQPEVLILMGPFVDYTHPKVGFMEETYESHFENLVDSIMGCFKGLHTKVILIPSQNDAHHHPVYPCPSFEIKQKYSNLICVPDPCLLDINGLIIGATSVDVLFHLSTQEISRKPKINDRMSRLISHIINQRCFYPLYPPAKGMYIDYELLLKNCMMDVTPHILLLPSVLRHYIKNVNQCLVINPERLVKNYVGGNFAVINVAAAKEPGPMVDYLSCQIRKV